MVRASVPSSWRVFVLITLSAWAVAPVFGEVISTTGQPVDGEVPGVVLEVHEDETGITEVYFESDFEDLGLLILINGDPALGANDLDQFGGVLREALSCQGSITLETVNGNVVGATLAPPVPNVICCIVPNCSRTPQRSCDRKGGVTAIGGRSFSSFKDCVRRCV